MKRVKLILTRHGQSIYNQKHLFTGWTDIDLSPKGIQEAQNIGKILKQNSIYPNICFTSWLKRAIHTAQITLKELEWEHIDMIKSYKLNERHYGAWQGKNKEAIKEEIGEELFLAIRRGYETPPPPLNPNDSRVPWNDKKYANIPHSLLPLSESLKDTKKRVIQYFNSHIIPHLKSGKDVLISAHGNSLRALVMELENINPKDIVNLEIPTGEVIVYICEDLKIVDKQILK